MASNFSLLLLSAGYPRGANSFYDGENSILKGARCTRSEEEVTKIISLFP